MKKYIKPTVAEVEIENQSLMAASDPALNDKVGNRSWHADDLDLDWDEE